MSDYEDGQEVSELNVDSNTVALLNRSEIDMQISTAKKYPRSVKNFRNETLQMVTLNEAVADSCIYALPRGGKTIEGPSARFAEVIASAWGNCRAGARVINDDGKFITAQGVFHDLERNVSITYEVQRRITDKNGNRFKDDMIGVTGNAASSIALRNAILKGVPKAFWDEMYQAARATVMGDFQTLGNRRAEAMKAFLGLGVSAEQVFDKLEVSGVEDITLDHLVILRGLITAIRDGDTTPEMAFDIVITQPQTKPAEKKAKEYDPEAFAKSLEKWRKMILEGKKTADQIIAMASSKGVLSKEQIAAITAPDDSTIGEDYAVIDFDLVRSKLEKADDVDVLDLAADLIGEVADEVQRGVLMETYKNLKDAMESK